MTRLLRGKISLLTLAVFVSVLMLSGCDSASVDPLEGDLAAEVDVQNGDIIPGQYIVVLDEAKLGKAPAEVIRELVRQEDVELMHAYGTALQGFAAKMSDEQADELGRDERIKYVEPNRMIVLSPCKNNPNHPKCGDGGDGGGGGTQEEPWGIKRVGGAGNGAGKTACVLDTGVDLDHPDLNVDVAKSVSFVNGESVDDGHGHGTHVAGTIGAVNNNEGVIGVAAGATIVGIKVLANSGGGTYDDVIAGIDHVAANPSLCDVANMSLGGGFSQAINDAVIEASAAAPFTLAAGNESTHAQYRSPASANGPGIYTISAFERRRDRFASYSNYGNPPVDYAAPGSSVKSTYKNGGYATLSGTSMAAPHVAGIILLGPINTDGTVRNDRDNNPDQIAHR